MISPFQVNLTTIKLERHEADKTPKRDVAYTSYSLMKGEECQFCINFIPPDACKTVQGPINLGGWCTRFSRQGDR